MISNIDSIFFSLDIQDYDNVTTQLMETLEKHKEIAKENKNKETQIKLKGKVFTILPNGARFHSYILHNDTLELKFSQVRSKSQNNYPIAIRIKSQYLWEKGFFLAYETTIDYINQLIESPIIATKISRADLCCHTDKFKIESLDDLYINWKGNYRKVEHYFYNRKVNGLTFGSFAEKNIMARVYDKTLEIKSSNKQWFNHIWQENKMNIENIWNIEFQIGRNYFKEHNIESVNDFIINMRGIWEYLTKEWLGYIQNDVTNIARAEYKPVWKEIQNAYNNYCSFKPIKREKQLNTKSETLIPLLVGVLTSYGACKQENDLEEVLLQFNTDMKEYLKTRKDNIKINEIIDSKIEYLFS